MALLMSVFIHGWVCLAAVNLDGTFSSMDLCSMLLNCSHYESMSIISLLWVELKSLMSAQLASLPKVNFPSWGLWIHWLQGGVIQVRTMSWSLLPIAGSGLHLNLKLGWLISIWGPICCLSLLVSQPPAPSCCLQWCSGGSRVLGTNDAHVFPHNVLRPEKC